MSVDKRFGVAWVIYILLAIISIWQPLALRPFAEIFGSKIPSINSLNFSKVGNFDAVYVYFGISTLFMIPLAVFIILDGGASQRIKSSVVNSPHGRLGQWLFLYVLGLPVLIALLLIVAIIPFTSFAGESFGAHVAQWVLSSNIGLLTAGSFLLVGLTGMLAILFGLIFLPIGEFFKFLGSTKFC